MHSKVSFVHNVAGGPDVDIWIDDKPLLTSVPYKTVSGFMKFPIGYHNVKVYVAGSDMKTSDPLVNNDIQLTEGMFTAVVTGDVKDLSTIEIVLLIDNSPMPAAGKAHIRFFHGAAAVPGVDLYAGMSKILSNVKYTESSEYIPVTGGKDISISVTAAGDLNPVLGPAVFNFESGSITTIIASGRLDDKMNPITALISKENKTMCTHMDCMSDMYNQVLPDGRLISEDTYLKGEKIKSIKYYNNQDLL
jgi:hypothetical protein